MQSSSFTNEIFLTVLGFWAGPHQSQEGSSRWREQRGDLDSGIGYQGRVLHEEGYGAADRVEAAQKCPCQHPV